MLTIKQWLVVEGKNDSANLKRYFKVNTIETKGWQLNEQTKRLIMELNKRDKVIVFCDPDSSGEKIREAVTRIAPDCLHAYLRAEQCRHKDKVGVEFASELELTKALGTLVNYYEAIVIWSTSDLVALGCIGGNNAKKNRLLLSTHFQLGDNNGKRLMQKLNALAISKEAVLAVLKG